jgi:hypothetical protein
MTNHNVWKSEDDERLRRLVEANVSTWDIATCLGRTVPAIEARAHTLRITLGTKPIAVGLRV